MPLLLIILWLAAIIYTIREVFQRKDIEQNTRLLWTILIVVAPVLGLIIYYLFGHEKKV